MPHAAPAHAAGVPAVVATSKTGIVTFLRHHGCEVRSIRFQCDADCRNFAKDLGWQYAGVGPAHSLADIVAWLNSHGREPKGTVAIDLAGHFDAEMAKRFK